MKIRKSNFFSNIAHLFNAHKGLFISVFCLAILGTVYQYNTNGESWLVKPLVHAIRFCLLFIFMMALANSSRRFWYAWAYYFYFFAMLLLIIVGLFGFVGMGAKRWIDLCFFNLQPSEIMKITVILALARYYTEHNSQVSSEPEDNGFLKLYFIPFLIIFAPFLAVLKQPDLGTAVVIATVGLFMMIMVEQKPKRIFLSFLSIVVISPVIWPMLHEYQKVRVLTFLNPERDPFGAGYHILQSKITLGSGGWFGKGFLMGTQSKLNFLPEKHTDFIFATICEEMGFVGGLAIISIYVFIVIYGLKIARSSKSRFCLLTASGISIMFGLHVFINIAMVIGLIPVVGIPLHIISYGGSSMLTFMTALGILLCISSNKHLYSKLR